VPLSPATRTRSLIASSFLFKRTSIMSDSLLLNSAEVRARHILAYVFRFGADFPLHITALIRELATTLHIDETALDRSLRSLEQLEESVRAFGGGREAIEALFPHLVAYMGEVLIDHNGGSWYMLWRPEYAVWEPYVVTESGEFCDPFTHLYDQLHELDEGFSLLAAISRMTEDAGL
jgi:hypothetical protein